MMLNKDQHSKAISEMGSSTQVRKLLAISEMGSSIQYWSVEQQNWMAWQP